ncbi:MAG: phosphohexomutase domain-containing protein, partial [Candidatus Helarchaeales archaeon]
DFGGLSPNPSKKNLELLERTVVEVNADMGLACDGDGDRSGIVTERGEFVRAHETFCVLLKYLIEQKKEGVIVKTIDTTSVLNKMAAAFGLELVEVPIGSKYIGEVMRTRNALIGGEQSGGLMFQEHIAEKDGIYTNLKILEAMAWFDKPLGEIINDIISEFGAINFDQLAVNCPDERKGEIMSKIESQIPEELLGKKVIKTLNIDGFKLFLEDESWLLIRPSGTEPVIRVSAEAGSKEEARKLTGFGKKLIERIIQ